MKTLFLLLLFLYASPAWRQIGPAKSEAGTAAFFSAPDKVLPRLFEAATRHSAEIARLDAGKEIASEEVKLARKRLLNMFSIASSYSYGTLPYFATADAATRVYQLNPFSQGARAVYSAGVNVVAPLDMLFGRRSTVHRQELMLTQAEADRTAMEDRIRAVMIEQYQALAFARTAMQHFQEATQSASINRRIADKKFKEGEIQVDEQIAAIDFYNKAVLAEEEAKNKYQTAVLLMENLIGMPISTFMQGQ